MDEKPATKSDIKHLEELLLQFSDSLARQITDTDEHMRNAAERIDSTVNRHSGMIVNGGKTIVTISKTIGRLETQMRIRDRQLADLKTRVRQLERKR